MSEELWQVQVRRDMEVLWFEQGVYDGMRAVQEASERARTWARTNAATDAESKDQPKTWQLTIFFTSEPNEFVKVTND